LWDRGGTGITRRFLITRDRKAQIKNLIGVQNPDMVKTQRLINTREIVATGDVAGTEVIAGVLG
jgi:hypothetical protein